MSKKKTIVKTVMDYLVKDGLVVFNSENIYNDFNFDEAKEYSDVAIYTISRYGTESQDMNTFLRHLKNSHN